MTTMKKYGFLIIIAFLLGGCASSEKKQDYSPSPSTIQSNESGDKVQQKIDKRIADIQKEKSGKYRIQSLMGH